LGHGKARFVCQGPCVVVGGRTAATAASMLKCFGKNKEDEGRECRLLR